MVPAKGSFKGSAMTPVRVLYGFYKRSFNGSVRFWGIRVLGTVLGMLPQIMIVTPNMKT